MGYTNDIKDAEDLVDAGLVNTTLKGSIDQQWKKKDSTSKKEDVINLSKVRAAIPDHCWKISTWKSTMYLLQDFVLIGGAYALRYYCLETAMDGAHGIVVASGARLLWWNLLGFFLWCLFMCGHDAGHGTFSSSPVVNMIAGHIAHTPLLVPFHGWRQSHRIHHKYHNDLNRDKTWTPIKESTAQRWVDNGEMYDKVRFTPLSLLIFPYYLLISESDDLVYGSHFNPFNGTLFTNTHDRVFAAIGTTSIVMFISGVVGVAVQNSSSIGAGLLASIDWYFIPYLIFTMWLSLVTNLHHTHPESTFYRNGHWSFVKGAASTIDRDFGSVINYLMHHIETHVVHHLFFTKIPHYNLVEATEYAKPALGVHYKKDLRNPLMAFLEDMPYCKTVTDEGDTVQFREYEAYQQQQLAPSKKSI
eukprot:CFRG1551T1